jgi:hypothetical protein
MIAISIWVSCVSFGGGSSLFTIQCDRRPPGCDLDHMASVTFVTVAGGPARGVSVRGA